MYMWSSQDCTQRVLSKSPVLHPLFFHTQMSFLLAHRTILFLAIPHTYLHSTHLLTGKGCRVPELPPFFLPRIHSPSTPLTSSSHTTGARLDIPSPTNIFFPPRSACHCRGSRQSAVAKHCFIPQLHP